ncbi:reverse transcriptase family protein [Thioclava litoralis]|uniref:RNA-directed DNA polymerase n=1 Tax=Thioclava litoralis TaxID=3076557 RepID=A0ABZ1E171_9RHOB|nr:reverse transcriptase family protein [Thioclava sp. FTW29]
MRQTSPQQYKAAGHELEIAPAVLNNAAAAMQRIASINSQLFPLLTLKHLSIESDVSYGFLRKTVAREAGRYRHIYLRKKVPGRKNVRMVSIPEGRLLRCQKWISENILRFGAPHQASYAYHPGSNPVFAARAHTEAKWLIKVDIQDFFHAISEHQVYRAFRSLGYARLMSFELARLCTMPCERLEPDTADVKYLEATITHYYSPYVGILPQGAPTSPMLSNLVMKELDAKLAKLADDNAMNFSRYADDIVFSCKDARPSQSVNRVKRLILKALNDEGFRPNLRKTKVRGPGTRKVVLGILVDGKQPRLPREYKDKIRQHLHYLTHPDFGPAGHASARKTSVSRIYHHVFGLICWAKAVEPSFGEEALRSFNAVNWPPISKPKFYS